MSEHNTITDDKLNLFIDEQLDSNEMDVIRQQLLDDAALRERVCQLKAIRELVRYAYENVPGDDMPAETSRRSRIKYFYQSLAAGVLLVAGLTLGWFVNDAVRSSMHTASADEVFQYFKHKAVADRNERKIILHVTTGDIMAVNKALNEAEQLLASYREAGTPMKLDIVTYRDGINMLRVGVSPYIGRIEDLLASNENVTVYACHRSVEKAKAREGHDVELMPQTITAKTAKEIISERLEKGWIYIKV